jgi:NAD(P)-dependent dehydrogenase (short-subunit alcohol dehydrogenase family)
MGRRACAIAADLADSTALEGVVAEAIDRMGSLDVLVNNAAMGSELKRAEDVTPQEFDELVQVNLKGSFFLTTSAARRMMASGGGSIVNISSMVARVAAPRAAVYAAAKAGIESLTRTLAVEWAKHGIRVNAVAPGYVASDLTAQSHASESVKTFVRNRTPLRRMADPEEMVGAVVYLASDASSFQTGSTIVVDGGWTAW